LFWESGANLNEREVMFLRLLGVLVLAGYGWILVALIFRLERGTWQKHCDNRILFFSGIDDRVT